MIERRRHVRELVSSRGYQQDQASQSRVGVKLKHARLLRGLRLKDVAKTVGCTESLVSKIENGRASPSLNMLHRIADAVGTNIAMLFSEVEDGNVVQRAGSRPVITQGGLRRDDGITLERLVPATPGHLLQGNLHVVQPGGRSEGSIAHDGEEVGYVIDGILEVTVDGRTFLLSAGDSFFFNSALPHSYRNPGNSITRVVWVNSPPTY